MALRWSMGSVTALRPRMIAVKQPFDSHEKGLGHSAPVVSVGGRWAPQSVERTESGSPPVANLPLSTGKPPISATVVGRCWQHRFARRR